MTDSSNKSDQSDKLTPTQNKAFHWSSAYYRNLHLLMMTLIVIVAAGASSWNSLPKIEDPRITQRNISVITEFPGASARLVESSVTELVESSIASISEIKKAVVYGNVMGSFAVEKYGLEGLLKIKKGDIAKRVKMYEKMIRF